MRFQRQFLRTTQLLVILLLVSLPLHAGIDKEIRKSFEVGPGGTLELDTDRGSIEVTTHRQARVDVRLLLDTRTGDRSDAARMLEDFEVDFRSEGHDVSIEADYDGQGRGFLGFFGSSELRVRWEIVVPETYHLDLRTAGGSIDVKDLNGNVDARTSGGSLVFGHVRGTVSGKTSGGSISIEETGGTVDVSTSGGSVRIDRAWGDVRARTSGGSIRVNEVFGAIDAVTSGGSISASISAQPENDCRLSTSGGNITVVLDPAIALDVDARSSGGRVSADVPVTIEGQMSRTRLSGQINGGGPLLTLRTSGGGISVRSN